MIPHPRRAFLLIDGVAEVAAFAVPSDVKGGEDEIMLAIVLDGRSPAVPPAAIVAHAREHLPRFAQPRYMELRESLPKTASEKVKKAELKNAGVTERTIDLQRLASAA